MHLGLNRVLWGGVFLYVKEANKPETIARYGHGTPDASRNISPWGILIGGEQLVKQTQDWCKPAETSGIAPLVEFSSRLRSYA